MSLDHHWSWGSSGDGSSIGCSVGSGVGRCQVRCGVGRGIGIRGVGSGGIGSSGQRSSNGSSGQRSSDGSSQRSRVGGGQRSSSVLGHHGGGSWDSGHIAAGVGAGELERSGGVGGQGAVVVVADIHLAAATCGVQRSISVGQGSSQRSSQWSYNSWFGRRAGDEGSENQLENRIGNHYPPLSPHFLGANPHRITYKLVHIAVVGFV